MVRTVDSGNGLFTHGSHGHIMSVAGALVLSYDPEGGCTRKCAAHKNRRMVLHYGQGWKDGSVEFLIVFARDP